MDRNSVPNRLKVAETVALRKESVDRNHIFRWSKGIKKPSLSARRAWIEIAQDILTALNNIVALRKESVDRNKNTLQYEYYNSMVALRKESVDRNVALIPDK